MKGRRLWFPAARVNVRAADGDSSTTQIEGYGAVFNSPSLNFGGWRELIEPGAFTRTLASGRNVFSFVNHDPHYVLGRSDNASLALEEDETGLRFSVTPPETTWARDLLSSMARGDINGSSFMFEVVGERWVRGDDGVQERRLTEVRLFEVGPVTMPAYPAADSGLRAASAGAAAAVGDELDLDVIPRALGRRAAGLDLPPDERRVLEHVADELRGLLAQRTDVAPQAGPSLDLLERQLDALTV